MHLGFVSIQGRRVPQIRRPLPLKIVYYSQFPSGMATWGSIRVSQEAEDAKGKHGQKTILCFLWVGKDVMISSFKIGYFE